MKNRYGKLDVIEQPWAINYKELMNGKKKYPKILFCLNKKKKKKEKKSKNKKGESKFDIIKREAK